MYYDNLNCFNLLIYKKYLIKNLFKPLIISLITLIVIIWSSRVVKFMDYIVQDGAGFLSFFKLTLLVLPSLVMIILPLAVFLTAILTYDKLIENREIIILKNCGIKKIQLLLPLITLSIIMTIISYFISLYGGYKSNLKIREIRQEIQNNLSFSMIKAGSFIKFKDIVIYADAKDENIAYNIIIYNKANAKSKGKDILVQAEKAEINKNIITLYNGNFQRFDNSIKESPEILFFSEYNINFDNLTNEPNYTTIKRLDSLSTIKLFNILHNYKYYEDEFKSKIEVISELNYRLTFPLTSLIIALLSGSIILHGAFNRLNNRKTLIRTSLTSIISYILLLSLYQKVENGVIFMYILYIMMFAIIILSCYLIRERKRI